MDPLIWAFAFIGAFTGAFLGGMIVSWPTYRDAIIDYRRHGFDNHLCHDPGCPTCGG
jgi:hypothetical protein